MKKVPLLVFVALITLGVSGFFLFKNRNTFLSKFQIPDIVDTSKTIGEYTGSYYKGNYVWGLAMNLAWNDLNENILHDKVKLDTTDKKALELVEKLNNSPFSKKDLDEESYYIKSGYSQKTVDAINKESRKKFPTKSFGDLKLTLGEKDIIAYAYFLKEVEYEVAFKKATMAFLGETVESAEAGNSKQKENVKVVKYDNNDKFIIKLQLKDNDDEMFLAKGYDMLDPRNVVKDIVSNNKEFLPNMQKEDIFKTPFLHLDHHRSYTEIEGKMLSNTNPNNPGDRYEFSKVYENIKFDMDEKGARVENEAVVMVINPAAVAGNGGSKIRYFVLDKPYWVVMKRASSQHPYFILGVNNTEIMNLK